MEYVRLAWGQEPIFMLGLKQHLLLILLLPCFTHAMYFELTQIMLRHFTCPAISLSVAQEIMFVSRLLQICFTSSQVSYLFNLCFQHSDLGYGNMSKTVFVSFSNFSTIFRVGTNHNYSDLTQTMFQVLTLIIKVCKV